MSYHLRDFNRMVITWVFFFLCCCSLFLTPWEAAGKFWKPQGFQVSSLAKGELLLLVQTVVVQAAPTNMSGWWLTLLDLAPVVLPFACCHLQCCGSDQQWIIYEKYAQCNSFFQEQYGKTFSERCYAWISRHTRSNNGVKRWKMRINGWVSPLSWVLSSNLDSQ